MLETNPYKRISVAKVLEHKWIKQDGFTKPSPLSKALNDPVNEVDEDALQHCHYMFPGLTMEQLREKVKSFGYHTASYLLLRNNDTVKKVSSNLKTCSFI